MDLVEACGDDRLFRSWFKDPATWRTWFTFIRALFALPAEDGDLETFTRCTGRAAWPTEQALEAWITAGRRSGKSFVLALAAVYLATFKDWRPYLAPGEVGTVMVIACDRRQARVVMRYIQGFLTECPLLAAEVDRTVHSSAEGWSFELANRVTIEVHVPSFRRVRGYTVVAALLDEIAFWRAEDSANPDREVLEAIRPALATVPGSMLLAASSPYARRGVLWDVHRRHYAQDGPVLVWQAPTVTMNPLIAQRVVDDAMARDAALAASEWLAEFRGDLESFVTREAIEACVEPGVRERPRAAGIWYSAFCDPSGGRQDAMTLAVAHKEGDCVILDALREVKPPFDPASVVREFAEVLRDYGLASVSGDRYGGEWPAAEFRSHGIGYQASERPKGDLFRELLPLINSRRAELLDNAKLVAQLCSLERRVGRGGRDAIDHPRGAHDDLANAMAGALVLAVGRARLPLVW